MSQFDRLWRTWLSFTLGFTVLLGVLTAGFLTYRAASTADESRQILRHLLLMHLENERPRIADEVYLRLDSLEQREKMLNEIVSQYGSVELHFSRTSDDRSAGKAISDLQWTEDKTHSRLSLSILFGELHVGMLEVIVTWAPVWTFPAFRYTLLVSICLISLLLALWLVIYWTMKRKVFLPAMQEFQQKSSQEAFAKVASQVAHDIRSPLAALAVAEEELSGVPEDVRLIVRSAINRIRDITNDLSEKKRKALAPTETSQSSADPPKERISTQCLPGLLEEIVSEKRVEFRNRTNFSLELKIGCENYGVFADVQATEFKRTISNLIDNSADTLPNGGNVTVTLATFGSIAEVYVQDDGPGIPEDILPRLGERGQTYGKKNGSGLGLFYARQCCRNWGGDLRIESKVGQGTLVALSLFQALPPKWFVEKVRLQPDSTVVVLDDDDSIHHVWRRRIENAGIAPVNLVHHFSPSDLRDWVAGSAARSRALFLVDYELSGHAETGLDLIREMSLQTQSVLVTSRIDEPDVIRECAELGVRIIPKRVAGLVPVELGG